MSIDFAKLVGVKTDRGVVTKIELDGKEIWNSARYGYVSLGDSIAAGHTINEDWKEDYGEDSQYGKNGNISTIIVPNSYTDLIRKDLEATYGKSGVTAVSFARSGDTVADLMEKLTHDGVRRTISKANLVTICIGANDILQPAMSGLGGYIDTGNIDDLAKDVDTHLATLNNDEATTSYKALFDKLTEINRNATYVFTTIYNPYKYLRIEESTSANDYKDGFLGPLMWCVPDTLGSLATSIRGAFFGVPKVKNTIDRVNRIGSLAEGYITLLNNILRTKINEYGNPNILLADTKAVFDPVPDRPISSPKHYNDLVNVEVTNGYVIEDLDWGQFWSGVDWTSVLSNIDNIANTIIDRVVNEVVLPAVDVHPAWYGHYALKCSFAEALGWLTLPRRTVTYAANGGGGSMETQTVVALDNMSAYANVRDNAFSIPGEGYYFTNWLGGNGQSYANGQFIGLSGNLTLTAQWSDWYTLTYTHSQGDVIQFDSGQTGPMECYELWVAGTANNNAGKPEDNLGAFSNPARTFRVRYNTSYGVIVRTKLGKGRSYIRKDGVKYGPDKSVSKDFIIKGNTTVNFEWNQWQSSDLSDYAYDYGQISYWNCYIT